MITKKGFDRIHARWANVLALLMVVFYAAIRGIHFSSFEYSYFTTIFIVSVVSVLILMMVILIFIKKVAIIAFLIPSIMTSGLFFSIFLANGIQMPYFFVALVTCCALSIAYLQLRSFVKFALFLNVLVFVFLVLLEHIIEGWSPTDRVAYFSWVFVVFCQFALFIALRHVTNRQSVSNVSMTTFYTMLMTTPNLVVMVDALNRVTFLSDRLTKLANIDNADYAIGRPLLDLFHNRDMAKMIANVLKVEGNQVNTARVIVDGETRHFKVNSICLKGNIKGRFIDITDVTSSMRVREIERVAFAKELNNVLAKIVKSPEFTNGSLDEAAKVVSREGCLALNVSRVGIWLLNEEKNMLKAISYYCYTHGNTFSRDDFALSDVPEYTELLKYERLIVINDTSKPNPLDGIWDTFDPNICSILEATIRVGSEFVGMVCIEQLRNKQYPNMREWSIDEQNFATSLGDFMAMALSSVEQRALIRRNQYVLNNLPGMAYQCTNNPPDFTLVFVSMGSEELTGYTSEELMSGSFDFLDIVHSDDRDELFRLNEETLHIGLPLDTVFRIITKNGTEKWIWERSHVATRTSDGTPLLLEGFYFDITKQHRAEIAEHENRAKSDFLARMSHEIRTPMNAILGMTEIILRDKITKETREQALVIKHSGDHLLSIINDILDFSKIESGKLEIMNTPYLFHSVINDVISIIKMRLSNPDVRFMVYIGRDVPNALFGDAVRLRQVILNLLANAAKYTKKGHFALEITSKKADDNFVRLCIRVNDTGIGIKPEDMGRLFDEFAQFDLDKNMNVEGTGLGLAITKNLVKLMGGSIEAYSKYDKGSEFIINLAQKVGVSGYEKLGQWNKRVLVYCRTPIEIVYILRSLQALDVDFSIATDEADLQFKLLEEDFDYIFAEADYVYTAQNIVKHNKLKVEVVMLIDSYEAFYNVNEGDSFPIIRMPVYLLPIVNLFSGEQRINSADSRQHKYFVMPEAKILVVDDIKTNLKVCEGLMRPYEVGITTCLSGKEAIAAVKVNHYDLVLMDHMMPEMDGLETVKIIRSLNHGAYENLPIIALTANAIVGAREMFLQNGFDDFLSKPIEIIKLNEILAKWIPKEKQQYTQPVTIHTRESVDIHIEGVDTTNGLLLSGGDIKRYIDILTTFHKDSLTKIIELSNCLKTNNLLLYATYIHALKSASANIGAKVFSEKAKIMEEASIRNDIDFIVNYHDDFAMELEALLENINMFLDNNAKNYDEKVFNIDFMKDNLLALKRALDDFDVDGIEVISESLQDFTHHPDMGDTIHDILQNAFLNKYKQAEIQIEDIIKRSSQPIE
ncbi:MAG: ATP-binding protein [Defluviitaleaceae bacterium]|nr:ATP-binding protein [Defluviitaleaceae bacterium]